MNKTALSRHELFSLISLFFLGGAAIVGGAGEAGRASWLAMLIAFAIGCALICVYLKIGVAHKGVFDGFLSCFSHKIAAFFAVICAIFAIYAAIITISIFLNFTAEAGLLTAPKLIIAVFLAITFFFMLRGNIAGLGHFAAIVWPICAIFISVSIAVALSACDIGELIGAIDGAKLMAGTYSATILPYGEAFFAIMLLAPCVADKKERVRGSYSAVALGTAFMIITFIKNLCALGLHSMQQHNFPSFIVSGMVPLGGFFQRFEIFVAMNFLICIVFKAAVFLLFAREICFGLYAVNHKSIKPRFSLAVCIALSAVAACLGAIIFSDIPQLFSHLQIYKYIMTFPVIILPIAMLISKKIKQKSDC